MLHDVKYAMKFKDRYSHVSARIYLYNNYECLRVKKGEIRECDYFLDSTLLEYFQKRDVIIMTIKKECIDQLFENLFKEIKDGTISMTFILYNIKGIRKLLNYCGHHMYTRSNRKNRYVIHYFTHRISKNKRRRR